MTAPLPIAVVGCGLIGLRHAQVATKLDRVDLTAVVEPDAALRARLAGEGYPVVASLDDVPARTRAAIIATPTPAHAESGLAAIERGWAVLVEKPLAANLAQADALIEASERRGVPLVTAHHRRCHPFVQATAERLAELGTPVAVQGIWSLRKHDAYYEPDWRRAPGSGPLMTNLSHEIDLMRVFLGEIAEVSALSSNATRGLAIEDTAAVSLRFESGVLGSFLISDAGASPWSFEAASGENPGIATSGQDYMRFVGTKGAMSFPSLDLWQAADGQEPVWQNPMARLTGTKFAKVDPLEIQMALFEQVADGRDPWILASGKGGRATLEATLAAVLSAKTGRPVPRGGVPAEFDGVMETAA